MSRSFGSYDADWQRRKAVLIRSLFHDIPTLSPVEEESDDSSHQFNVRTREVFASPSRPYSPLPPLIIEKVPITNKHDEPEEYYSKLKKKIKRIYKKLFIEKRNLSSINYYSNYSDSSVNDDNENNSDDSVENVDFYFLESKSPDNGNFESIIEDREARQNSSSTKSNGYGADFESMDTAIIDVVNYTASNEDSIMISEEEESDSEIIDGDRIRYEDSNNLGSSENKGSSKERIDDAHLSRGEESHHSSINDHRNTESEESIETEYEQQLNNETKSKQDLYENELKSKEFEKTASEHENQLIETNVESMEGDVETSDFSEGPVYRQITTAALVHFDGSDDAGERESRVYEDSTKSVILPTGCRRVVVRRNVDVGDRILPILDDNADSKTVPTFYTDVSETTVEDFEQVATPQLDAKEEGIIEMRTPQPDSPEEDNKEMKNPRLDASEEDDEEMGTPQPESVEKDNEEMSTIRLEAPEEDDEVMGTPQPESVEKNNEEMSTFRLDAPEEDDEEISTPQPESAEEDVEEMGSPHPIEQMRTPRTDLSHGTILITHRSDSESTSEHTAAPQALTTLTSSTQDGADKNMSELQTSNDMNEILTSIFNESRNKHETPISGRKRKFVDKSVQAVQTSRATWEEMRANFFVGTPKIFRLCACTDHICN